MENCDKCVNCDTTSKLMPVGNYGGPYAIFCRGCFTTSPEGETPKDAIDNWNQSQK